MKNYIKTIKHVAQKVITRYSKQYGMAADRTHNSAPHGHLLFGQVRANSNHTHTSCCHESCNSTNTSSCDKRRCNSKCHCDTTPCDVSKIVLC